MNAGLARAILGRIGTVKLDFHDGVLLMALAWCCLIAWMAVTMLRAPEGVEDERGFRVVRRDRD
jgi:hypothetical protein